MRSQLPGGRAPAAVAAAMATVIAALASCSGSSSVKIDTQPAITTTTLLPRLNGTASSTPQAPSSVRGKVGVVLVDGSASRWAGHQRALTDALGAAGFEPIMISATDETASREAAKVIDASLPGSGVRAIVLAGGSASSAAVVRTRAAAASIPVVDYGAPGADGGAALVVAADQQAIGALLARSLVTCVSDKRVAHARLVELTNAGDPNTAAMAAGYGEVLKPRYDSGDLVRAGTGAVTPAESASAVFDRLLSEAGGRVDGVLTTADDIALTVIGILQHNGLELAVVGAGVTLPALRAVVQSQACASVGVAPGALANEVAKVLADSLDGGVVATNGSVLEPVTNHRASAVLVAPRAVTRQNIAAELAPAGIAAAELCADLASQCAALGVH